MYEHILKDASGPAQERIRRYIESCIEGETPESLQRLYNVKDMEELVNHLVEYECGTRYTTEDPLINDYLDWVLTNNLV